MRHFIMFLITARVIQHQSKCVAREFRQTFDLSTHSSLERRLYHDSLSSMRCCSCSGKTLYRTSCCNPLVYFLSSAENDPFTVTNCHQYFFLSRRSSSVVSMPTGNLSHRKTHNLLLITRLFSLRENTSPFTLILDSLEQSAKLVQKEFVQRARVRIINIPESNHQNTFTKSYHRRPSKVTSYLYHSKLCKNLQVSTFSSMGITSLWRR